MTVYSSRVNTLKQIFIELSLFNTPFLCLNLTKCDPGDFITYAGIVNHEGKLFKIESISDSWFKCLIFTCSLSDIGFKQNTCQTKSRYHATSSGWMLATGQSHTWTHFSAAIS